MIDPSLAPQVVDVLNIHYSGLWSICEDIDNITWKDGHETTDQERKDITAKLNELLAEWPKNELRIVRDSLLKETDWVTLRAYSQGVAVPAEWAAYQQALRDITNTYTSLDDVVWPTKPE